MDLLALVENSADADLLREMIGLVAGRLLELEVGAPTGADNFPPPSTLIPAD